MKKNILISVIALVCLALPVSVFAQGSPQVKTQRALNDSRKIQERLASGEKMKVQGTIVTREGDTFILRNVEGTNVTVRFGLATRVEDKKLNPFRDPKAYSTDEVTRGLFVVVEGRGDPFGILVAEEIKFTDDFRRMGVSIDSQIVPVEKRVNEAEGRLTEAEHNQQRLSGEVDEVGQVAKNARSDAAAALKTADHAVIGVNKTNERVSSLDTYEEKESATVNFKVGSAVLTPQAMVILDELAMKSKSEHGFAIEVRGLASSDGSASLNERLSDRRADAVVHYLVEQHEIPLRRIVLPFGYGEAMPVADNTTREGRQQNRRVEVKLLVNRGL